MLGRHRAVLRRVHPRDLREAQITRTTYGVMIRITDAGYDRINKPTMRFGQPSHLTAYRKSKEEA